MGLMERSTKDKKKYFKEALEEENMYNVDCSIITEQKIVIHDQDSYYGAMLLHARETINEICDKKNTDSNKNK
jgi:hypothetical protein